MEEEWDAMGEIGTHQQQQPSEADLEKGFDEKLAVIGTDAGTDAGTAAPTSIQESTASETRRERDYGAGESLIFSKLSRLLHLALEKSHSDPLIDETPPDGGFKAWLVVFFSHQAGFNTFGFLNAYGVLQAYYVSTLDLPPSTISWIGSLTAFLMLFIGAFSGRLSDAGYFHQMLFLGTILQIVGFIGASFSTTYWQILLSHGICLGIGGGLVFVPAMSIVGTYFTTQRALALAIVAIGNSVGGLVFAAILQNCIPALGYAWTMRVCGLVVMASSVPANFLLKPMKLRRVKGPIIEWGAFKEIEYSFLATAMFLTFLGMWVPVFYVSLPVFEKGAKSGSILC